MKLSEIEELPKKLLWEQAGRAFWLQASRAVIATEWAKMAYEDGHSKVSEAGKEAEAASDAVRVALEETERSRAAATEAAVREAISKYRSSEEFTALLDNKVGSEMADLVYLFKRFNPGQKLNLNFGTDPPPLPEGVTEEMIEDYEGEDAPPVSGPEGEAEDECRNAAPGAGEPSS
ncbi:hypothetical protein L3X38_041887 [Prunus dulcis]|uniref:Uncharacterized protein n=1 Tax=Prunus dulcis TaxID=3755 RepID=A0AAD4YLB6_PRUDU|nr:hypothetical protein L3X38_041887 [Prunus dulcis]